MRLVPKQLLRAGMTGDVPYYGGRFTPAQAYAASHPRNRVGGGPPKSPRPAGPDHTDTLQAMQHLLDRGVITPEEYQGLRARMAV